MLSAVEVVAKCGLPWDLISALMPRARNIPPKAATDQIASGPKRRQRVLLKVRSSLMPEDGVTRPGRVPVNLNGGKAYSLVLDSGGDAFAVVGSVLLLH